MARPPSEDAPTRARPETLAGRFRTWRTLQRGPASELFLAEDEELGRRVTVKRLPPDVPPDPARSLRREAEVGRRLAHPALVAVHELVVSEEGELLVMEYLEGELLSRVLRSRPIPVGRALEVVEDVGAALDHMHRGGVLHGDVATRNVLLGFDGAVKLIDLGLAIPVGEGSVSPERTSATLPYMAPERFDQGPLGPAIDVYGLAAVAYEALARESARPLPSATAELLRRGMSADPGARPRSAGELAGALSRSLAPALARETKQEAAGGARSAPRPAPRPVRPPEREPARLAGRYRILRSLGAGWFATVFLAEDERRGERVAVKRLHPDSPQEELRRLEREAEVGFRLDHPDLVAVRDFVESEEGALLVMEHLEGERLSAALERGPVPVPRVVEVVEAVAAALDHMHANGVLHGDVSLKNILLGSDGRAKLIDLGLAITAEDGFQPRRGAGPAVGKLNYMAPERFVPGPLGPGIDVYALGVVTFEALTRRRARPRLTSGARVGSDRRPVRADPEHIREPPPHLLEGWPEAPAAAAALVRSAMDHDPARRPPSAGAFASELADALRAPAR